MMIQVLLKHDEKWHILTGHHATMNAALEQLKDRSQRDEFLQAEGGYGSVYVRASEVVKVAEFK